MSLSSEIVASRVPRVITPFESEVIDCVGGVGWTAIQSETETESKGVRCKHFTPDPDLWIKLLYQDPRPEGAHDSRGEPPNLDSMMNRIHDCGKQ